MSKNRLRLFVKPDTFHKGVSIFIAAFLHNLKMAYSILLFGATSLLGFHLAKRFPHVVLPFISPGNKSKSVSQWPELCLHDTDWLIDLFSRKQPDILLYCHAVCDVPKCEVAPRWTHEINVQQVARVLEVLPAYTRLVYVSSDHVFSGDGVYDEESKPCPISVYGRTRVEAERLVLARSSALVIRAGLGIGRSPDGRTGHLDWLWYRTKRKLPMTIIRDEHRSVVWQHDLAMRVMQLAESEIVGVRHISATRAVSRVELAEFLNKQFGIEATFRIESRHEQPTPHLGRVELASVYQDALACPLTSVLDGQCLDAIEL